MDPRASSLRPSDRTAGSPRLTTPAAPVRRLQNRPAGALTLPPMDATSYHDIKSALRRLHLNAPRPWLVGFSGGNLRNSSNSCKFASVRCLALSILQTAIRSFTDREIDSDRLLQITAPVSPGRRGGPLFDKQGKVVGAAVARWAAPPGGTPGLHLFDGPAALGFSGEMVLRLNRQKQPQRRCCDLFA